MSDFVDGVLPKKESFRLVKCHEHLELLINSGGQVSILSSSFFLKVSQQILILEPILLYLVTTPALQKLTTPRVAQYIFQTKTFSKNLLAL
jgi:hypothetical protein